MLPIVNRLIKISDYGKTELENKSQLKIDQQRARELLQEKDVVANYAVKYRGNKSDFDFEVEADNAVYDLLGHQPETGEEEDRAKNFRQKFQKEVIKIAGSSMFRSVAYATTNKEKVNIIEGYRAKMSDEDLPALLATFWTTN